MDIMPSKSDSKPKSLLIHSEALINENNLDLHDEIEKFIARKRITDGVFLTKPKAAAQLLILGIEAYKKEL